MVWHVLKRELTAWTGVCWLFRVVGLYQVVIQGGQGLSNLYQGIFKDWFINDKGTSGCKRTGPVNTTKGRNRGQYRLPMVLDEMADEVMTGAEPENTAHIARNVEMRAGI